jgi:LacI family transcriptional regulator
MRNASPTLKAIAARLGVSVTTVSRSINGQGTRYRISEKTQRAVQRLARRLDFAPNPIARGLRLKKTATIGLVIPDVSNPFFARIAHRIAVAARDHRHSILLADSQEDTALEVEAIGLLMRRQVDGLILCPVGLSDAHLRPMARASIPFVLVDRHFPKLPLPAVTSDNVSGARQAMRHLLDSGHRRIGVLQGLPGTSTNRDRIAGLRAALATRRLAFDPSMVAGDTFLEDSGYRATRRLLRTRPRPTALFAMGNLIALGALRAIADAGLRVPHDVSLVGFDDHPYAAHLATPITTVAQDVDALGRVAAELLFARIGGHRATPVTRTIPTRLVERRSVRPLATNPERKQPS